MGDWREVEGGGAPAVEVPGVNFFSVPGMCQNPAQLREGELSDLVLDLALALHASGQGCVCQSLWGGAHTER